MGAKRRALIAFDIANALPPGAEITQATLRLFMSRTRVGAFEIAVHRVTEQWGEASSNANANEGMGAPSVEGDATWTHRIWNGTPVAVNGRSMTSVGVT